MWPAGQTGEAQHSTRAYLTPALGQGEGGPENPSTPMKRHSISLHLNTRASLVASRPEREEQAQRPAHHARPKVNTAVERRVVASPRGEAASLSGDL